MRPPLFHRIFPATASARKSISVFRKHDALDAKSLEPLHLFIFAHYPTQNRFALLLEMLVRSVTMALPLRCGNSGCTLEVRLFTSHISL
ncbi:hypothetical protein GJU94_05280 [Brucella sp. 10RB9214]|nr:hypothetical protein BKD02_04420 [Brucella sp. 09RB8910]MRN45086.1 hypothetical protein [Brucella sp. 10RB9212]MRN49245.1 hypothetical protein [Brucella sp. 10RB9214]